jgi:hypothetical protein
MQNMIGPDLVCILSRYKIYFLIPLKQKSDVLFEESDLIFRQAQTVLPANVIEPNARVFQCVEVACFTWNGLTFNKDHQY